MIRAATLFSGIGAPEVAMPDWEWLWHAEIEAFPSAVLRARRPHSQNLGDVNAADFIERAERIGRPDVLVFGSPCQSFSIAGKRLGLDDARGNLALVALGLVGRLRPAWIVFENVPGLFSSYSGSEHAESVVREGPVGGRCDGEENRDFAAFLTRLRELGYFGCWRVFDAQYFGVAQRRRRVFFVGYFGDWRRAAAVLFEPEGLRGDSAPRREKGQIPAPTIASRPTGGGGLGTDFDCDGGPVTSTGDVSHCLNAGGMGRIDYETETMVTHALRADGFDASEDGTGRGTPIIPILESGARTGKSTDDIRAGIGIGEPGDPMFTLQSGKQHAIAFSAKDYGADAQDDLSPTIRAGGHTTSHANAGVMPAIAVSLRGREGGATAELSDIPSALRASGGGGDKAHVLTSMVRHLTPKECERLQGFPDNYTLIKRGKKAAADGPRYKALGNSMAVPVLRWILSRIEMFEAMQKLKMEAAE